MQRGGPSDGVSRWRRRKPAARPGLLAGGRVCERVAAAAYADVRQRAALAPYTSFLPAGRRPKGSAAEGMAAGCSGTKAARSARRLNGSERAGQLDCGAGPRRPMVVPVAPGGDRNSSRVLLLARRRRQPVGAGRTCVGERRALAAHARAPGRPQPTRTGRTGAVVDATKLQLCAEPAARRRRSRRAAGSRQPAAGGRRGQGRFAKAGAPGSAWAKQKGGEVALAGAAAARQATARSFWRRKALGCVAQPCHRPVAHANPHWRALLPQRQAGGALDVRSRTPAARRPPPARSHKFETRAAHLA